MRFHWKGKLRRVLRIIGKTALVVILLALCAVPAVVTNTLFGYLPALLFVSLLIVDGMYVLMLSRCLDFDSPDGDLTCSRGETLDFSLRIGNRSILPCSRIDVDLFVTDVFNQPDTHQHETVALGPRGRHSFRFGIRFAHIGTYGVGVESFKVHDLLGMFSRRIEGKVATKVQVDPLLRDFGGVEFSSEVFVEGHHLSNEVINEGMDYSCVREYRIGDPIKAIHWKLSAHSEGYYTKIYETYTNPGISIVMDFAARGGDSEVLMGLYDAVVEAAFSLNSTARDRGLESEILYLSKDDERKSTHVLDDDYRELLYDFPLLSGSSGSESLDLLRDVSNSFYAQGNVALCTSVVDTTTVTTLIETKLNGRNPILVFAIPDHVSPEERTALLAPLRRLDDLGIEHYLISSEGGEGGPVWSD